MLRKLLLLSLLLGIVVITTSAQVKIEDRSASCCKDGSSFKEFIEKKTRYPQSAQENNIQGQVIIEFTIDKNGKLKDFNPVKYIDKECAEYAINALKASPDWLPEIKKGKPVKSKTSVVLYFKLRGADMEMDIEPMDGDIIIWGYGNTKVKSIMKGV